MQSRRVQDHWRSLTRSGAVDTAPVVLRGEIGHISIQTASAQDASIMECGMRDTSTEINSYDPIQRDFHWVMAAVILTAICVGVYAADLPKEDTTRGFWFGIHKSLGVTAFFLAIMRIGWR